MERRLGRDVLWGMPLGGLAGLTAALLAARGSPGAWLAVTLLIVLAPFSWWVLRGTHRWVAAFLAAAFLLPPLPLPWGDSGPHPSVLIAALGLLAGMARQPSWNLRRRPLSAALVFLGMALLLSVPLAALYSGPLVALGSLARVALFFISVYAFFYVADGPGRDLGGARLARLLFWTGFAAAGFACLDFYFQFPAPSRFAEQFVWLPGGVFRRAMGMFYEASTLAVLCIFLLVMVAAAGVLKMGGELRIRPAWLLLGGVALLSALILSFSRTALASLAFSLGAMLWVERERFRLPGRLGRPVALVSACLAGGVVLLYALLPQFLGAWLERLWYSGVYFLESPNLILSRRVEGWRFLAAYLHEHPWHAIFGIGYKTLPYSQFVGREMVADNMYLALLIETGVLGLGALLLLHGVALGETYRWAKKGRSRMQRFYGLWLFGFWCALALQMTSGDVLTYWRILPAFFVALAVGVREPHDEDSVSRSIR